jgi:predicted Fe-Mo cluster-binding NifX family protein
MKVALTVWQNRISPLFDSARRLLVVDFDNRRIVGRHRVIFDNESAAARASTLSALGVDILICGAISDSFVNSIKTHHIDIISFVSGNIDEVIEAYVSGTLGNEKLVMPGCKARHDPAAK